MGGILKKELGSFFLLEDKREVGFLGGNLFKSPNFKTRQG